MKFQKYLFSTEINGNKIEKYSDGEKVILLHKYKERLQGEMTFKDAEKYEDAIDSAVDETDVFYNKANALNSVLKAFFNTDLS